MIHRLLIATRNTSKVAEFRELLGRAAIELDDLCPSTDPPDVAEVGQTFRDNACIKASAYARHVGFWSLADDSGLAVDALSGHPGVFSARWAQVHNAGNGDAANNQLLLRQLEGVADAQRTARFVCVLALADPRGAIRLTARDSVEGTLLRSPRGTNGFGYDPLFHLPDLGRTTAELAPDVKHQISHRGKAVRRLTDLMIRAGLVGV